MMFYSLPQTAKYTAEFRAACKRMEFVEQLNISELSDLRYQQFTASPEDKAALQGPIDQYWVILRIISRHRAALALAYTRKLFPGTSFLQLPSRASSFLLGGIFL